MVWQINHRVDNNNNQSNLPPPVPGTILDPSEFERGLGPNLGRRPRQRQRQRRTWRGERSRSHSRDTPAAAGFGVEYEPAHAQFKSHIPIPTPFEYTDEDTDDFRGPFDFDQAWAGGPHFKSAEHPTFVDSPKSFSPFGFSLAPCFPSSASSSSGSSGSSGTSGMFSILTPNTPHSPYMPFLPEHDQEYDEFRYRLDLGAESPYLGSAYADVFPTKIPAEGGPTRKESHTGTTVESVSSEASPTDYSTHCGICLREAVSPCRTRCCEKLYCLAHITDWLRSKESSGLCPSCDRLCILPTGSLDKSSSHSRYSSSSSTSSASSSGSSTAYSSNAASRISTTDSSCSTLTCASTSDAEDLWDVKASWKKDGGESLNFSEIARDVVGGSMKFVGLARCDPSSLANSEQPQSPSQGSKVIQKFGSRGGFGGFDAMGSIAEMEQADFEIGEVGVGKRVLSIMGLVLVLFVLLR